MHSLLNKCPHGILVAFSVRSSQQIEHRGYSLAESLPHLQSLSVIAISGRVSMADLEAGGVPERPRSSSERRRMCYMMDWLSKSERKFKSILPKRAGGLLKTKVGP
jgi:hypothetical protein